MNKKQKQIRKAYKERLNKQNGNKPRLVHSVQHVNIGGETYSVGKPQGKIPANTSFKMINGELCAVQD